MTVGQAFNKSSEYHMIKALGKGSFGVVYKCIRQDTKEMVALKSLRKNYAWIGEREAGILKSLNQCCHGTRNVVKLNRHFMISDDFFLEFEMLDMTISQFMVKYARPMHMYEIQAIAQQTVEALDTLKSISVVHLDLKPDNIMFIDHKLHPMKVKVIDFGLATLVSNMTQGKRFQASSYRAPEVTLGLHLNEAVDMWSLGCVLAFMYLRSHLFSRVLCEHQVTREIVQIFGLPETHLLDSGVCTRENFLKDGDSWRLVETCKCEKRTNVQNKWKFSCLHDIVLTRPHTSNYEDTQAFVSLLKDMMQIVKRAALTSSVRTLKLFCVVQIKSRWIFPGESHCAVVCLLGHTQQADCGRCCGFPSEQKVLLVVGDGAVVLGSGRSDHRQFALRPRGGRLTAAQGEAVASMGGFGRAAETRPGSESFKEVCKTLNDSASTKPLQAAEGYWEKEEEEEEEGELNNPETCHLVII
ncbi:homeodomain-interacting protein kinase 1-like [Solea senegalensis]|uniref:Homeodomain-interacting protein kinase 1-like n=1 Tax=Solea senegalensis TaxID=28829 RepID=A0AAV6QWV6_SOLSE|nr:homeodomain-interacting protein kinase 1-like [Solea senegalensis]